MSIYQYGTRHKVVKCPVDKADAVLLENTLSKYELIPETFQVVGNKLNQCVFILKRTGQLNDILTPEEKAKLNGNTSSNGVESVMEV